MATFVAFTDFLRATAAAEMAQFQRPLSVVTESEFERMRDHILRLYGSVNVSHSYHTRDGNCFDCIPILEQPSLGRSLNPINEVPEPPTPSPYPQGLMVQSGDSCPSSPCLQVSTDSVDDFGNRRICPEGTIPMRRITLEELTRFSTLEDFFFKSPQIKSHPRLTRLETVPHRYAHAYQIVNNIGGSSRLNLWSPTPTDSNFSLSQHWYTGGSGTSLQTVEGGWQNYPKKYNFGKPVLFIYWTADGYGSTGNYNLDAPAFVQISRRWHLGAGFESYSVRDGDQVELMMQWKRDARNGNWWLFLSTDGMWDAVGYYPSALFGTGQLASFATEIDYGGEVTGSNSGEMGSGEMASEGVGRAAYQRGIWYTETTNATKTATLVKSESNPSCYTVDLHNNSGGDWGSYFYFGGSKCP